MGFVHITFIYLGAELRASGLTSPSSAPLINIYSYHKLGDTGSDKLLMERIWTRRDITFVLSVKRLRLGTSRQCTKRQSRCQKRNLLFWSFGILIFWIVSSPKCQVVPQQLNFILITRIK